MSKKKVKPFPSHKLNRRKKSDKSPSEPSKLSIQLGKIVGTILVAAIVLAVSSTLITVSISLWKWALGL